MQTEFDKLKQFAIDRYELDGGVMYESMDDDELIELIQKFETAENAWSIHMRIIDAMKESQSCYDNEF